MSRIENLFPDYELACVIAKRLGLRVDDEVSLEELEALTGVLEVTDKAIESLDGIQYLKGISEFRLPKNQQQALADFDLSPCCDRVMASKRKLRQLFPDRGLALAVANALQVSVEAEVSLDKLERLRMLEAARLSIESLEGIHYLKGLWELDLSHNYIRHVEPLGKLTELACVRLDDNEIRSLDGVESLKGLTYLFASKNRIRDLKPLAWMKCLQVLKLNENRITSIEAVRSLKQLRVLEIRNNRIQDFSPLCGLHHLCRICKDNR